MPELLCFLFELALAHVRLHSRRCEATDGAAEPPPAVLSPEGSYLRNVVRPIYECVFAETFSGLVKGRPASKSPAEMPTYPLNYDDWNEAFCAASTHPTLPPRHRRR